MAGNEQIRAALSRTHAHLHLFRLRDRASGLAEPQAEHRQLVAAVVAGVVTAARSAMTTTATDRSGFGLRPNRSGSRSPTETVHLVV